MPFRIGVPELILVLVIAILIFGPGRISKLGGELGKSISSFQREMKKSEKEADSAAEADETTDAS
ncbi:MAG: twin-arginine translocase TatA/TatE family subunit [Anaerolineae bacterium]|nr:twin-arginine translocase TatA/TatE family subunit [Anaerolineae bacterium]